MKNELMLLRSLISNSGIIRFAIWLGLIFALMCAGAEEYYFVAFVFMAYAIGLGVSLQNYRKWEVGELVPGLRQAHASVAVKAVLVMWIVVAFLAYSGDQTLLLVYGVYLILIAYGLCFGVGVPVLSSFAFVAGMVGAFVLAVSVFRERVSLAFEAQLFWPSEIAFVFFALGGWLLWLAHQRAVSQAQQAILGNSRLEKLVKLFSQTDESALIRPRKAKLAMLAGAQRFVRLERLLFPLTWKDSLILAAVMFGVLWFIFGLRGNEEATIPLHLIACIAIIMMPPCFFMSRIRPTFERAWISGFGNGRRDTAGQLFELAAIKCAGLFLLLAAALSLQMPAELSLYITSICILLVATGIGAICLWVAARTYRFWVPRASSIRILFACGVTIVSTFLLVVLMAGEIDGMTSMTQYVGPFRSIAISMGVAFVGWGLCFVDGARAIANESMIVE